jgi:hypothetical protein
VRGGDRLRRDAGGLRAGLDERDSAGGGRDSIGSMALRLVSVLLAAPGKRTSISSFPPELARTLPRELRKLVGYKTHQGLGVADPGGLKS